MARLDDDDFQRLRDELGAAAETPLGFVRGREDERRDRSTDAWLAAGDTLAEKAIAALDLGDEGRAGALVARLVALPPIDDGVPAGPMAVSLLLIGELVDPLEEGATAGLLEAPLRLLPDLDPLVAAELRTALASLLGRGLPTAVERRIREAAGDGGAAQPFAGVPDDALPAAVTGVLRLVLRLRSGG